MKLIKIMVYISSVHVNFACKYCLYTLNTMSGPSKKKRSKEKNDNLNNSHVDKDSYTFLTHYSTEIHCGNSTSIYTQYLPMTLATKAMGNCEEKRVRNHGAA